MIINKFFHYVFAQKDLIGILILRISGAIFSFILFFFLARLLNPETYGEFTYSYNLIALISLLSYFGFEFTLVKFIPRYFNDQNKFFSILFYSIFIGAIITIIIFILLTLFKDSISIFDEHSNILILFICIISYFFLLRFIGTTSLNAVNKPFLCQVLDISFIGTFSLLIVISYYSVQINFINRLYLSDILISCLVTSIFVATYSIYLIHKEVLNLKKKYQINLSEKKQWLKTSIPIYLRDISNLSFDKGDIFLLGLFVDPVLIGFYFTSQKVVSIIDMLLDSILIKIRSAISQNILKRNFSEVNRIIKKVSLINLISCVIFAFFIFYLSGLVLSFFNIESNLAIQILRYIVIFHIFISPFNYIIEPLIYANKQITVVVVGLFYNFLNIILLIIFMEYNSIINFIIIVYTMRILSRATLLPFYYNVIIKS